MRRFMSVLLAGLFSTAPAWAATEYDGSKPLICALMTTFECTAREGCIRGVAVDINAPNFIHIDFEDRLVVSVGKEERKTEILSRTHVEGRLLLQGVQRGLGWSVAIDETDGTMTLTGVMPDTGFVVTGACTPLAAESRSFK